MEFIIPGFAYFTHGRPISGLFVLTVALIAYVTMPPFGVFVHVCYLFDLPYLD